MPANSGDAFAEPLASPSFGGPLKANPDPIRFDAGPLGNLYITGQLTGMGIAQGNAIPFSGPPNTDPLSISATCRSKSRPPEAAATLCPGRRLCASLAGHGLHPIYGYHRSAERFRPGLLRELKPVTPNLSLQVGSLPSLIGGELTFTFQNMDIAGGLLSNQEPAISRGVQVDYSDGPFNASVSLNDGFYSGTYNWLSGLISYATTPTSTIALVGGGNLSDTEESSTATPLLQNNSSIFNITYTYSAGPLTISPYLQYTRIEANPNIGIDQGAETYGRRSSPVMRSTAISRSGWFKHIQISRACWSVVAGSRCLMKLLDGWPDSGAWSLTLTPTYQRALFFARGEASYTRIGRLAPGFGFGSNFDKRDQVRLMFETGVLF